jgi:hypothetical protein
MTHESLRLALFSKDDSYTLNDNWVKVADIQPGQNQMPG